jgi:hypothetical protein
MTLNTNNNPSTRESDDGKQSGQEDRSTTLVPTRVGRNTVDIDVPKLRHLVSKMKSELMPDRKV